MGWLKIIVGKFPPNSIHVFTINPFAPETPVQQGVRVYLQ
jgi:hypothetical protein